MTRRPPFALLLAALVLSAAVGGAQEVAPSPAAPQEENELDRLLSRLTEAEKALHAERERLGPSMEVVKRRMLARARAHVKQLRAGSLPAGGGFDALVDYAAQVERTRRALDRDREAEAALKRRLEEIEVELAKIRVMRAPLDVQREAMVRARMALQQADERRAAFARAFESSVRPPDYMAIYGADSGPSDSSGRSAGFAAMKGRLPLPVSGRAEARRVMRRGAGGPGLELQALAGATARSVAAGRVAFADVYDDYGLTVILDHGDSFYSVYGGLQRIDVRVGDNAPEGARIGAIGGSGALPAILYFEIRHRADTIDPGPWLGL